MVNIFNAMRDQNANSTQALDAGAYPPLPVAMTVEEAIQKMDCLFSHVIAAHVRKERGLPPITNKNKSLQLLQEAKSAAKLAHLSERSGTVLSRIFDVENWTELLELESLDVVQNFAESPMMNPSVCIRIILSMNTVDITK